MSRQSRYEHDHAEALTIATAAVQLARVAHISESEAARAIISIMTEMVNEEAGGA